MKRLDVTGETADEIFYEAETLDVDDKDLENKEELYDSHDCSVVNHEFITSRDLSVKVRSYSGQTSMVLFSCSLSPYYIWRRGSSREQAKPTRIEPSRSSP